eukprot:TRINITY_DN4662_c0_g1_i1.p2 TRINITY_DN4662_c0_g1~~TRINITY_DN4662_c0_g1_i1.p2  ORF type:complete len:154 (+),score=39.02 TRINITY_DN4662_c0_g1_i1:66-527(+)
MDVRDEGRLKAKNALVEAEMAASKKRASSVSSDYDEGGMNIDEVFSIVDVPFEVLIHIVKYSDFASRVRLLQTCWMFNDLLERGETLEASWLYLLHVSLKGITSVPSSATDKERAHPTKFRIQYESILAAIRSTREIHYKQKKRKERETTSIW